MTSLIARMPLCTTYHELSEYRKLFNCLLCCEMFTDPCNLNCHHIFCETCLQAYYSIFQKVFQKEAKTEVEQSSLPCPTCRKVTSSKQVTSEDSAAVSILRNRKVSVANDTCPRCDACVFRRRFEEADFYCNKCALNFCSSCKSAHEQHPLFKGHAVIHISNKDTFNLYCDVHSKMIAVYFCLDCDLPSCTVCILQNHNAHRTAKLRDALAARRDLLKTILNTLGPKLDRLESKMKKLTLLSGVDIRKNGVCNGSISNSSPDSTHSVMEDSHSMDHDDGTNSTGSNSSDHQDMVKFVRLSRGGPQGVVHVELLGWLVVHYRRLFEMSTKMLELSQSKKLLAVYEDLVARIQTILDVELEPLQESIISLTIEKEAEHVGSRPLGVPDLDSGSSISSVGGRGRHSSGVSASSAVTLDVDREGDPVQTILTRPKLVWKVEKQRSDIGEMWNPCGAVFLPDDRLIVAEYDAMNNKNNKLRLFDRCGRSVSVLSQGQVQPLGVALTREGHIAVTDCKGKRVKIITLNGQTIIEIGKGQFGWPYGIATNSRGHLVVSDAFSDSVSVYHVDGKRIRQFGSSGSQNSCFRNPYHVAVDSHDNILVSDSGNNCVKVFDSSGRYIFSAGGPSVVHRVSTITSDIASGAVSDRKLRRHNLKGPRGLSVDQKGNILIADDCGRVGMFDSQGQYVRNLLSEEESIKYPEAVHCGPHGLLAVTEWNPNNMFAVKVFTLYE